MNIDDKAKEIGLKWYHDPNNDTAYRAANQMGIWAKETILNMSMDWLRTAFKEYGIQFPESAMDLFLSDYKQSMEKAL